MLCVCYLCACLHVISSVIGHLMHILSARMVRIRYSTGQNYSFVCRVPRHLLISSVWPKHGTTSLRGAVIPVSVNNNTPPDKKTLGKTGFQSTKSGGGERLCLSYYAARDREKGALFTYTGRDGWITYACFRTYNFRTSDSRVSISYENNSKSQLTRLGTTY